MEPVLVETRQSHGQQAKLRPGVVVGEHGAFVRDLISRYFQEGSKPTCCDLVTGAMYVSPALQSRFERIIQLKPPALPGIFTPPHLALRVDQPPPLLALQHRRRAGLDYVLRAAHRRGRIGWRHPASRTSFAPPRAAASRPGRRMGLPKRLYIGGDIGPFRVVA
jgi:hypothetical protein